MENPSAAALPALFIPVLPLGNETTLAGEIKAETAHCFYPSHLSHELSPDLRVSIRFNSRMTISKEPQSLYQETKVSEIPVVELKSSSSDDNVAHEVIEAMKVAGVCIVRNLLSQSTVDKIRQELLPHEQELTTFER
jgi:hypothetical protein